MADLVYSGQAAGGPINTGALPVNYDLVIYRGDTLKFFVQLNDLVTGTPIDITTGTVKAQLKRGYDDMEPIELTCTKPGGAGLIQVVLLSAVTTTLVSGSYIWDLQVTTSGENRTYVAGDVTVIQDITR